MLIDELTAKFFAWNTRNRAPATVAFYRARLKRFCQAYNARNLASLTPLEIDEHLAEAAYLMDKSMIKNRPAPDRRSLNADVAMSDSSSSD